jgi:hypothetical protein
VSRRNIYPTRVDKYTRSLDVSLAVLAKQMEISPSTLLKVRALNLDRNRGLIHWTTLVLIGAHLGIFQPGESIGIDDPRLRHLAPRRLRTTRGRGAPHWYEYQ